MKATGIVRRIDDLGRVVIPKEIRRTMRIREGDPLEIYTDNDGEVIFKKYSPIGELGIFAAQYADVLYKTSGLPVVVCDRDHVIAVAGIPKKELLERRVSPALEEVMEHRRSFAFTDDGRGIQGAGMLRRAMDYGKMFGKVFMSHCQDEDLVGDGQINEGVVSTRLGLLGWPAAGEELQIARDIQIAELTGAKLHIQHISTARGLAMVRAAKDRGLPVTCEATPHHLFLTEEAIDGTYNTCLKVNPPLRTAADAQALIAGVADGTVDAIVTDHAPHADWEKSREFELAPFGMTGLETSLALVITNLVKTGTISFARMVELMAIEPRKILGLEPVSIAAGSTADITVFDADATWTVTEDGFVSQAQELGLHRRRALRPRHRRVRGRRAHARLR